MKNGPSRLASRRNIFGISLLTLGVIVLLNQIFPYNWFRWDYFWPIIIIVLGIAILLKK